MGFIICHTGRNFVSLSVGSLAKYRQFTDYLTPASKAVQCEKPRRLFAKQNYLKILFYIFRYFSWNAKDGASFVRDYAHAWNGICSPYQAKEADMRGTIQIVSGLIVGGAGFYQIAIHPMQGICALFLAGFLVMTGFEKKLAGRPEETGN
jgi:hypothetical protein